MTTAPAQRPQQRDKLLRIDQAAVWLNVHERTIYRLLAEGQLIGVKVRSCTRVFEHSITDFLCRQSALFALEHGSLTTDDQG